MPVTSSEKIITSVMEINKYVTGGKLYNMFYDRL